VNFGCDDAKIGSDTAKFARDDAKISRADVKPRSLAVVIVDRENLFRNRKR
jgi:hypothetical protein